MAVATVAYGERIVGFMRERGMSWTVWCFHPEWPPALLVDWGCTPTHPAGEFFRTALQEQ